MTLKQPREDRDKDKLDWVSGCKQKTEEGAPQPSGKCAGFPCGS